MRNNGASLVSIGVRLASRGFDEQAIQAVLEHVPSEEPDNIIVGQEKLSGGRMVLVFVGMAVSVLGLFFVIGSVTGLVPMPRFFGFAVIFAGGFIASSGRS
jgi:hypothetical protein